MVVEYRWCRTIWAWVTAVVIVVGLSGCHSLRLRQVSDTVTVPPAGVRIVFRVLRNDGEPVERLQTEDFEVTNDETNRAFGSEGGGLPTLARPTNYDLFTILVLDMSDSIFANDAVGDVIEGAEAFVKTMVEEPEQALKQTVAIYAFGSTSESELWVDFTQDHEHLYSRIRELKTAGSRGGTNLYGAYLTSIRRVRSQRPTFGKGGLVTRSVVLLTDGTHEAGKTHMVGRENLGGLKSQGQSTVTPRHRPRHQELWRDTALRTLRTSGQTIDVYTIGIKGDYDEDAIGELASSQSHFYLVGEAGDLVETFQTISERVKAIANSNYVLGICSPIESGRPSVTIDADLGLFMNGSMKVTYPTDGPGWTGNVNQCDSDEIANPLKQALPAAEEPAAPEEEASPEASEAEGES